MHTITKTTNPEAGRAGGGLSWFCQGLFASLPRSDQRRWAEVYVRGLIEVPGRKSIRRISDHVLGWRADQCLQQFVNQSPWQWEPVRRSLATQFAATAPARAWVLEEAVFPKNGDSSVGVAKQYVPAARRTINCQLGVAVFMANESASCPVNWRLLLPRNWSDDEVRRSRTHVPEEERHRPMWSCALDAIDEMVTQWGLAPAPIVVDASSHADIGELIDGLEQRGLRYLVRIPADTAVPPVNGRRFTAGELAMLAARRGQLTMSWRDPATQRVGSSRWILGVIPNAENVVQMAPHAAYRRMRRIAAEWLPGSIAPTSVWLTNMHNARLPELVALTRLRRRTGEDMARLNDGFGLRHFEGRSFRGWHHHVTLASAAHAFSTLAAVDEEYADELATLRPYA
ncbi:IS701 family transposase [Kutzneria sp. NPDC051319]|uniref:IS701 family transposase n=1 Tax=Kutzneria sp. NPDC051319 TaxID=3155047 RepID=UPI00342227E2